MNKNTLRITTASLIICPLLFLSGFETGHELLDDWPRRVLITNDNGIDDPKIRALAGAFAGEVETYVVAPLEDRSGSTHYAPSIRKGALEVERRDLGPGVQAFAVDGYPADCVLLAAAGVMKDRPPDVVISGINGGPNLAEAWIGSGTIGAARLAAYAGFPALAVSGLDDDDPEAVQRAVQWVVRLAKSPIVRDLKPGRFLTVSIPRLRPNEIKGIRVTRRAGFREFPEFSQASEGTSDAGRRTWCITGLMERAYRLPNDSDVALYNSGYIVIVPMKADEHDDDLLSLLKLDSGNLPRWSIENKSP
jgi:5'-nucleotidase